MSSSPDITELHRSEELFKSVFHDHTAVKLIIDPEDGRIIDANAAAAAYYGWTRDELCRMSIHDINTLSPEEIRVEMNRAKAGNKQHFEFRHRRADGSIREVDVYSGTIHFRGKPFLHSIIIDSTDRHIAERRWKFALEGGGDGIWDWNMITNEVYFSKQWKSMLGYDEEMIENNFEAWERILHPDDLPLARQTIRQYLDGKIPHYSLEHRLRCRDGSWKWILARGMVIERDARGKALRFVGTHTDISEQVRNTEALMASEARFRDIAAAAAGILWEVDDQFRFTFISSRITSILGFEPNELMGRTPTFFAAPDERDEADRELREILQQRSIIRRFALWVEARSGERIRFELHAVPFNDISGRFAGYRGTISDVTKSYWAHEQTGALLTLHLMNHESDEHISEYLCKEISRQLDSPMAFFGFIAPDESEMIAHVWSPSAMAECRIPNNPHRFPVAEAGFWAEPIRHRVPVLSNDFSAETHGHKGLPTGHVPMTRYLGVPIMKNDRVIAIAAVANKRAPYREDDVERFRLLCEGTADFLELRRVTRELEEKSAHLAEAHRLAHIGAWRLDHATRNLHWSDEVYRIFEADPERFKASYEAFLDTIHPDDREKVDDAFHRSLSTRLPYRIVHRLLMRDGRIKHVEEQCETSFAPDGTPLISRGTVQDITDRVEASNALIASERRAVAGQFAAGIAHEFNNILTVIRSAAESALVCGEETEQRPRSSEGARAEALDTVIRQAERGSRLVRSLLDIVRPTRGESRPYSVERLVREVLDPQRYQLSLENVTLNITVDAKAWVHAEHGRLQQVLLNLVVNARHAMLSKRGGVLTIEAKADGDIVTIIVSDTGSGMSEDTRKKLFTPFFTTKGARGSKQSELGGTGLGLSVCESIIRDLGGSLSLVETSEKGTTFAIALPRCEADHAEKPTPHSADKAKATAISGRKILIVDDETLLEKSLVDFLKKRGHTAVFRGSAEEALSAAAGEFYDVAFLDLNMPRMNGIDLAKALKARGHVDRIVFMSGALDAAEIIGAHKDFEDCRILMKPYNLAEILDAVTAAPRKN